MVERLLEDEKQPELAPARPAGIPSPEEEDLDILDWDFRAEPPPPKARGTIHVRLTYLGRRTMIPADDPEME